MQSFRRGCAIIGMIVALNGCSTWNDLFSNEGQGDKVKTEGKREAVKAAAQEFKPNADVGGDWIKLPESATNIDWTQPGGVADNVPGHPSLAAKIEKQWRSGIGRGSGGDFRILARPIVAAGKVFAMDAKGRVAAFDPTEGRRLWRVDTAPKDADDDVMGGGIAFDDNKIFATTGFGQVVALAADDGREIWRRQLNNPLRSAPTVSNGRLYVISIINETTALNVNDGAVLWTHAGINETAGLLGAPSPAVAGDTVVVAYSSGELFALRTQNGRPAWGDMLAAPGNVGSLPAMAAIRGMPVINRGGVFAVGQSERSVAMVMRTGERAWEVDMGGINTPLLAGNTLFTITNDLQLIALRRDNGKVIWVKALQKYVDETDRDSDPVIWTGPVLAGGRLWAVNSNAQLVEFSPSDGKTEAEHKLPDPSYIAPVVAGGVLYVVTESGDLVAYK